MLSFEVIETLCEAKGDPRDNEDRLVVLPHVVAVIDGATSSGRIGGVAGGAVAADAVVEAIGALPAEWSFRDLVDAATAALARRLAASERSDSGPPSASLIAWNPGRDELCRLGDSHARWGDRIVLGDKALDGVAAAFRNAYLQARMRLGGVDRAAARRIAMMEDAHAPLIRVQHAFQNVDTGHPLEYGVIDGSLVPDRFLELHSTAGARELVLCSDGFPEPPGTLADGLDRLAWLAEHDPLLTETMAGARAFPPGSRFMDDTTYVRIVIRRD